MSAFGSAPTPWSAASAGSTLFLLSKVGSRATKLYSEALEPLGLRPRHVAALRFLESRDGASQKDLVSGLWSDSSSVVSLVDEFERQGLAERRRNPRDRRSYGVHITAEGRRVLRSTEALAEEVESRVLARLSGAQRESLLRVLRSVIGTDPEV
nr:MarR family winged helix-turn-helix transcriptional regulator [Geodermatophilus sabuli]